MSDFKSVVFCGYNVFPDGFAQTQRILLLAKGLNEQCVDTTVLCRFGTYRATNIHVQAKGVFEGINYIYCSGNPMRSNSFVKRNLLKFKGFFWEIYYLFKMRIKGRVDFLFISTNTIENALYYSILSKIFFIPSVIDNTEFWSAIESRFSFCRSKLYDNLTPYLFNKVICISDFLVEHTSKFRSKKNIIKIPAIVDFSKFSNDSQNLTNKVKYDYLLYCGSTMYYSIIIFIIESFDKSNTNKEKLILVCNNNNDAGYKYILERISSSAKSENIILYQNIPFDDLAKLYSNALALLIPLRDTIQDNARFPHKLGEYTASKGVIITTKFGEILNYFSDKKSALICEEYSVKSYSQKIDFLISNKEKMREIKINSYKVGLNNFDYKKRGYELFEFLFTS